MFSNFISHIIVAYFAFPASNWHLFTFAAFFHATCAHCGIFYIFHNFDPMFWNSTVVSSFVYVSYAGSMARIVLNLSPVFELIHKLAGLFTVVLYYGLLCQLLYIHRDIIYTAMHDRSSSLTPDQCYYVFFLVVMSALYFFYIVADNFPSPVNIEFNSIIRAVFMVLLSFFPKFVAEQEVNCSLVSKLFVRC